MPKEAFPLKIDENLLSWIRQEAMKENRSVNNWIETTLKEKRNESNNTAVNIGDKLHKA